MSEELRTQVKTIVVVATRGPADQAVSGRYERNTVRYGRWMRFANSPKDSEEGEAGQSAQDGLSGRAASEALAYTQDFPSLNIACSRR